MNKKYVFTTSAQVEKTVVVVLQQVLGAFVLRHFHKAEPNPNVVPATELTSLSETSADLVVVADRPMYAATALSAEFSEDFVFEETHQQWVNPSAMQDGLYGYAELYDFVALVAPVSQQLEPQYLYNHFVQSANAKASVRRTGRARNGYAHVTFVADTASTPAADWTLVRYEVPGVLFVDQTAGGWQGAPAGFSLLDTLAAVTLGGVTQVAAGAYVDVQVSMTRDGSVMTHYSGELVAEAVAGYCPKQRVQITNGLGQVRVGALGLDSGDVVRLKVGTRNVSGLADITIPVV